MKLLKFILILFLFISCKPGKEIQNYNHSIDTKVDESTTVSNQGKSSTTAISNIDLQITEDNIASIEVFEYDTSKDIHPLTGKPPDKRHIIINTTTHFQKHINNTSKTDQVEETQTEFNQVKNTAQSNQVTSETIIFKEKSLKWHQKMLIVLGKIYLVSFIIFIIIFIIPNIPKIPDIPKMLFRLKK